MIPPRIAVIGAGMAGLSCARILADAGLRPIVFEKSRGLGGRIATRRSDAGDFDHGAQFATAKERPFAAFLAKACEIGTAAPWQPPDSGEGWHVGTPAMNSLVKPLAEGLDLRFGTEIEAPVRRAGAWRVGGEQVDFLVSTVPAPQANRLFGLSALATVEMAPCWALMACFAEDPGLPDVRRSKEGDLSIVVRSSAKPGREAGHRFVAHASPEWSAEHLEMDKPEAAEALLALLGRKASLPPAAHAVAHRWRYARTVRPLGQPFLAAQEDTLFVGGDWCLGERIEDAHASGRAIAEAILSR